MKKMKSGGGWPAIRYTFRKARDVGGVWKLYKALRTKNACKTCALGMGGQRGGMVNEIGGFPEVCKKSLQAMAADMQGAIKQEFWSTYSIAQLKAFSPYDLEHCGRLTQPVLYERGAEYYRPIDWDEAIARITKRLKSLPPDETFWYFSGRSSNEAGFLLQLFARLYGTNNVNNCSYYCHQASGVGLTSSIGSGTATVVLEDVEHADLVFVIGGNPPSNHPRLMTTLTHIRQRGGEVIVINPVIETGLVNFRVPSNVRSLLFGTKIATLYVQPDIGGDLALLTGIAKRIDEMGAQDSGFLQEYCDDSEAWLAHIRSVSWSEIYAKSGVSQSDIDAIAERYAAAKNVVFSWTMGITHHVHGVQNVQAIANLAFMRGMVGRPNAGLLPIRGHSNVQGIGSVGVTPKLKDTIFERLESEYGLTLPTTEGLDTLGCMEAAFEKKLKAGFCLGGNLFGSNPDSVYAAESLSRLESMVYLSTTLNTGHAHGLADEAIILPVLARDEEPQPTTQESMFNYVRLSDGGPRRHDGPRSEVEVIAQIAEGVLADTTAIDWRSMQNTGRIRDAIAKVIPGYDEIAKIDKTKTEFQLGGRTLHKPTFPTPSGRGVLHRHDLPSLRGGGDQLRLMTVRSEGQFNTVVYENEDIYRGQDRRDVILLHPDDIARLGLSEDQKVTVCSETGEMPGIRVRAFEEIKPGNTLMYYPESNVLVPRHVDGQSKTPAFKGVLVTISTK
ncbi:MAG: FdhF/YdeP family oxidoreductase [Planctomycetaceae bacterium]|nr:FdhF/YdeP family oxidoreductase [Planctomycetales bacterium]MCB9936816.1 FdhF/YdeP family oxidoreductase [Planctomycetaceae bacterium]